MTEEKIEPRCYRCCGQVIPADVEIVLIPKSMDEPVKEDAQLGMVFRAPDGSSLAFVFDKTCLSRLKRRNGIWQVGS